MKKQCQACKAYNEVQIVIIQEASTHNEIRTLFLCPECKNKYQQGKLIINIIRDNEQQMSKNNFCLGHLNGFEHLDSSIANVSQDYDLGIKFQEEESDNFITDKHTGAKIWAEPLLILYISTAHQNHPKDRRTLRYGLSRSKFMSGLNSSKADEETLLNLALPRIKTDIDILRSGGIPNALNETQML